MLKFLLFFFFCFPLIFYKILFWFFQNILLLFTFLFIVFVSCTNFWCNISYMFGCDTLSYGMILLSSWVCSLMLMSSEKIYYYNNYSCKFILMVILMVIFLYLFFSSVDLFMFYLFFESSLIPTVFLILGWGYQPERLNSGLYLLFYTLVASLPMLISIMYLYMINLTMVFDLMLVNNSYFIFYLSMVLAFLVKMPMFLFHLWLPKAHVEAPISGSMILAGIMLKLGGYGLLRIFSFMSMISLKFNYLWMVISLVGGFIVSLLCLRQFDMKMLIAYSSVVHMSIVLGGTMTMNLWGLSGSYMLMIGHGLCSSGLFCLANISYERTGSRSFFLNKGLLNFMPNISMWWFLLVSGNMACPPTLNLLGEISLLISIIGWSFMSMSVLIFISFFSAVYSLYLYSFSQHGNMNILFYSYSGGVLREYLLLFLHWLPLNLLIINSELFMLWL